MELRHLKHFLRLRKNSTLPVRLRMEQSSLSQSIINLEAELGETLFQRTPRRTWLTRVGVRFYDDACRILHDVDNAATAARSVQIDKPGDVTVAIGEDLTSEAFTRFLLEFERRNPDGSLAVVDLKHEEAARLVREGGADLALTLNPRSESGLVMVEGWSEQIVLLTRHDHALVGNGK